MVNPRRQRLRPEARRARILEAALRTFAQRGYQEASMASIAKAAGITPAVIYDHFASKAELHVTLLESQSQALLSSVAAAVASAPDGLEERLRAGVEAFFGFVEQREFAWWLLFRDPPTDPEIAGAYGRIQQGATTFIAGMLREAAPTDLLARPHAARDLEMLAALLRSAQNGLAAWWYEHPETPRAAVVERVLEFAWLGLRGLAAGERIGG